MYRWTVFLILWEALFVVKSVQASDSDVFDKCPSQCACLGNAVDCSKRKLRNIPVDLPSWTEVLDVSSNGISQLGEENDRLTTLERLKKIDLAHNKLSTINFALFQRLANLRKLKLSSNNLTSMPLVSVARSSSTVSSNISHLILSHNNIEQISGDLLSDLSQSLTVFDLSFNLITGRLSNGSFPAMVCLRHLLLNDNRIQLIDRGTFDNLTSLEVLKLNKNKLQSLSPAIFSRLSRLKQLDLSGNQLRKIEGLRFQGLSSLTSLRLRRNALSELMDGAFWGLSSIRHLHLDYNNLTRVRGGFLFGLETLERLSISHNKMHTIDADSWPAWKHLSELDLSHNRLTDIAENTFAKLTSLRELRLNHNRISYIAENAFRDLSSLQLLDLSWNELSGVLDDSAGVFTSLTSLTTLSLSSNGIRSIAKRAFEGLSSLRQLFLLDNDLTSIQDNAFEPLTTLQEIRLNSTSLLCDCHLSWLPAWLQATRFHTTTVTRCGHPLATRGKTVFDLTPEQFICDDFPKPAITLHPRSQIALKDSSLNLTCQSVTSSDSPLTISWKKDHTLLGRQLSDNSERHRSEAEGGLVELTSTLRLWPVKPEHAGVYQCIASNALGTAYSSRATVSIGVYPRLTKVPTDLTVRAGTTARLECAATGQPIPEVAWQKDGGYDFPAARERRMHVMPSDDVFFIVDVKPEDEGIYTCTAKNDAGAARANATLTVIQTPSFVKTTREKFVRKGETVVLECMSDNTGLVRTRIEWHKDGQLLSAELPRYHMAADAQILIITETESDDAGVYTCVVSNSLGSERAVSRLTVLSSNDDSVAETVNDKSVSSLSSSSTGGHDDFTVRIGFAVIAGVGGIVLTSFIWVVVIYCLQRRRDSGDSSSTSTSDTTVIGTNGTMSDLSYGSTLRLKRSGFVSGPVGYTVSPVSAWVYDRDNSNVGSSKRASTGIPPNKLRHQTKRFNDATTSCRCQDSGCFCDDLLLQHHLLQSQKRHEMVTSAATLPRAHYLQRNTSPLSAVLANEEMMSRLCAANADVGNVDPRCQDGGDIDTTGIECRVTDSLLRTCSQRCLQNVCTEVTDDSTSCAIEEDTSLKSFLNHQDNSSSTSASVVDGGSLQNALLTESINVDSCTNSTTAADVECVPSGPSSTTARSSSLQRQQQQPHLSTV